MRSDQDFIGEVRIKIGHCQARRHDYVRSKLTCVAVLLGIGSLAIADFPTRNLFLLAPVVAFVYDLYIFGEDFRIRQARSFVRLSLAATPEERLWEELLQVRNRWFSFPAGPLSSAVILVIAAGGLVPLETNWTVYLGWLTANLILIAALSAYHRRLIHLLKGWETELMNRRDNTPEAVWPLRAED